jgi:hypothetical protein
MIYIFSIFIAKIILSIIIVLFFFILLTFLMMPVEIGRYKKRFGENLIE